MNNIYDTLFQDNNYDNHFFYTGRKNIIGLYHPDNYFVWGDNEDYLAYAKLATIKPIDVTKDVIVNETFEISVQIDAWGNPNIKEQYKEYCIEYPNSSVVKRFKQIVNNVQTGIIHLEGIINNNEFISNTLSLTFTPYCVNQDMPKTDIPVLLTYSTYKNKNNVDMPCYNLWIENKNSIYFDHAYEVSYKISTANIRSNSIDYLPANTPHTGSYYNISFCNENTADYRREDWGGTYTTSETTIIRSVQTNKDISDRLTNIENEINDKLPNRASCIINYEPATSFSSDPVDLLIDNIDLVDCTEEILNRGANGSVAVKTAGLYTLQLQHISNITQEGLIEYIELYRGSTKIKYFDVSNLSSSVNFLSLPITLSLGTDEPIIVRVSFSKDNDIDIDANNYSSTTRLSIVREK